MTDPLSPLKITLDDILFLCGEIISVIEPVLKIRVFIHDPLETYVYDYAGDEDSIDELTTVLAAKYQLPENDVRRNLSRPIINMALLVATKSNRLMQNQLKK